MKNRNTKAKGEVSLWEKSVVPISHVKFEISAKCPEGQDKCRNGQLEPGVEASTGISVKESFSLTLAPWCWQWWSELWSQVSYFDGFYQCNQYVQ